MQVHVRHTFSMELEMTSWVYKTAETAAITRTYLAGDPGTSLLSGMCKA